MKRTINNNDPNNNTNTSNISQTNYHGVIPDLINCSPSNNFTQISNEMLRNPKLTAKAKGILCLLLSNKKGWNSYIQTITKMMADGKESIRSGLKELEKTGHLLRLKYKNKITKSFQGSVWLYTDTAYQFNLDELRLYTEKYKDDIIFTYFTEPLETQISNKLNETPHNPDSQIWEPRSGNPDSNNIKEKILIITSSSSSFSKEKEDDDDEYSTTKFCRKKEVSSENCPYEKIKDLYHSICVSFPILKALSENRKKIIKARWKQYNCQLNEFEELFKKAEQSDFLKGNNDSNWKASFDWLLNESNMAKTLEGKYDNKINNKVETSHLKVDQSPQKLIKQYFPDKDSDLRQIFIKSCYKPAKALLQINESNSSQLYLLTEALLSLHSNIEQEQRSLPKNLQSFLPGPITLIENYINWIQSSHWINSLHIKMFDIDSGIFSKFRRDQASKDNLERDPLNGKSYIRG